MQQLFMKQKHYTCLHLIYKDHKKFSLVETQFKLKSRFRDVLLILAKIAVIEIFDHQNLTDEEVLMCFLLHCDHATNALLYSTNTIKYNFRLKRVHQDIKKAKRCR